MIGKTLNHYNVLRKIGRGGMGEVYAAEDTKLHRQVAIKVLPPELAAASERRRRFEREARAVASLDHPNIVAVYSIEEAMVGEETAHFITMPLIEGKTLDAVIPASGMALGELCRIAVPLADAIAAAHAAGIVHRDLKPSNVIVAGDGRVRVLDFGRAKMLQDPLAHDDATELPTDHLTEAGRIVGTAAYMSPEQAAGAAIDERSDIFSFGILLYEMATGERPFKGDSRVALVSSVLKDDPTPVGEIDPSLPERLREIVHRALEKDPGDRFQTASDLRAELGELSQQVLSGEMVPASGPSPVVSGAGDSGGLGVFIKRNKAAALVVAIAVAAIGLTFRYAVPRESPAGTLRITPVTSGLGWEFGPTWSPDGSQIAYAVAQDGTSDIAVLSLGGGEPHVIASGPHDEVPPRWSPDGSKIAFISDRGLGGTIYWVPPTGGTARKLAETGIPYLARWDATYAMGARPWSPDGRTLLFSSSLADGGIGIFRVDVDGGAQEQVTHPAAGSEDMMASMSFDGSRIAFVRATAGLRSIWTMPATGGEPQPLLESEFNPEEPSWRPDGRRIVFSSERSGARNLWEIDTVSGELRQLTSGPGADMAPTVSADGRIAYTNFGHQLDFYWLPIAGDEVERRLTSQRGDNFGPRVSPDGSRVVFQSNRTGNDEIWLLELDSGAQRQVTDDRATDRLPVWSPDGRQILFVSNRGGPFQLWVTDAEEPSPHRLIEQEIPVPGDPWGSIRVTPKWAPDGSAIGYIALGDRGPTLWLVDPDGNDPRETNLANVLSFDWYTGSRRVVYSRIAEDGSGAAETYIADLESGEEVLMIRAGLNAEFTVAPDGSAITYLHARSHFGMNLFLLPLDRRGGIGLPHPAGEAHQLTDGQGIWHVHGGAFSPDGGAVIYTRDEDQGDVYIIESRR